MKHYLALIFALILSNSIFALIEKNDYNDIGLNEKNGIYDLNQYLGDSFFKFYTAVGNAREQGSFYDIGFRIKMFVALKELQGFFFIGDFFISRSTLKLSGTGDIAWWNNFIPYFGETHFGYQNKYFTIKLGFQNLVSSDAIYNHLLVDDYSGSLFALRATSLLSRFVDMDIIYSMIRPHQSAWYNGNDTVDSDLPSYVLNETDPIKRQEKLDDFKREYAVYYGKSLYIHKLNIRPLPWIRFGVYEGVYFLGENLNPWYANPFFMYIASQMLDKTINQKNGSRYNIHAANLLAGIDFNIGFNGWRIYGEFLLDDFNGEYFKFQNPSHPDKFGFILGGELRGYLFTKYIYFDPLTKFILSNFYINIEYGIVSKYTYSRDSNFNYEYVRQEYKFRYDTVPPSDKDINTTNRVGNFLGFMYGPNSDCLDIAIGWRSDLYNVNEYTAGYQGDIYFNSFKTKVIPKRLFKIQLHFRNYRLGDGRDVILPYYGNQSAQYDLDTSEAKSKMGTSNGTEFLKQVLEIGDIVDLNVYADIVRLSRFIFGIENKFIFTWRTFYPFTHAQYTTFNFRWEFGVIINW